MVSLAPSDLLEYPVIKYFQYRNRGDLADIDSEPLISNYMRYYRKNPRLFFLENYHRSKGGYEWTKIIRRGVFNHSVSGIHTPYKPIVREILGQDKYSPVKWLQCHRYRHKQFNKNRPKSALLFIHGYAESRFSLHEQSYFRFFHGTFNSDVFALELPYHHNRQPFDSPFSGAYFLNGNPVRMLEAFRQSLVEIIFTIEQLKERYDRVILFGISLGGHLTALSSQLLAEVDLIAALASSFLFRLASKTNIVPVADGMVSQHKKEGLASIYKILYPTNLKYFAPFTTNNHTAVIGGLYDRIVPISCVQDLATMLGKPLFTYPAGHLSLFPFLNRLLRKINTCFDNSRG